MGLEQERLEVLQFVPNDLCQPDIRGHEAPWRRRVEAKPRGTLIKFIPEYFLPQTYFPVVAMILQTSFSHPARGTCCDLGIQVLL